jgi:hypothetical protein
MVSVMRVRVHVFSLHYLPHPPGLSLKAIARMTHFDPSPVLRRAIPLDPFERSELDNPALAPDHAQCGNYDHQAVRMVSHHAYGIGSSNARNVELHYLTLRRRDVSIDERFFATHGPQRVIRARHEDKS